MLLDRREKHIINELVDLLISNQDRRDLHALAGRINAKELGIAYYINEDKREVYCAISSPFGVTGKGMSHCVDRDDFSYPVGRMIAFARACIDALNSLDEDYLHMNINMENLVRGQSKNEV